MKVIHNFSSNKHYTKIPLTDILIWICGLYSLKVYDNTIKLYCKESDIAFLKKYGIYYLYDEIDTSFLESFVSPVDETNFWSIRKLACIENEFSVSKEPFVYMDTDIILNIPLDCPSDVLVWGLEPTGGVYIPLDMLSIPDNYEIPDWLAATNNAYNCGILSFKSKEFLGGILWIMTKL